ncbi:MAG: hypothetical protein U1E06_24295 [Tabrizicola sp.]|uniref:hypothetical protein n=1 Tax=Tabrizicola sp. TaxID=2005166 RepID=UPI002735E498|nr:hypothetical protein [Tabrizicola sp.]MDP3262341.1 hypothetical protein [Tabrizicola sp.]MDP3647912.1 hypothetical protein [Paracoccaceae bacterium]MDZ4069924.1 hypothetical protein [Tabrizicola sp.]
MPVSEDFTGGVTDWTETGGWHDFHDLMDELSRVGAGVPAFSLYADPAAMSEGPGLPPRERWLVPALRVVGAWLAGIAVPVRSLQRH